MKLLSQGEMMVWAATFSLLYRNKSNGMEDVVDGSWKAVIYMRRALPKMREYHDQDVVLALKQMLGDEE